MTLLKDFDIDASMTPALIDDAVTMPLKNAAMRQKKRKMLKQIGIPELDEEN